MNSSALLYKNNMKLMKTIVKHTTLTLLITLLTLTASYSQTIGLNKAYTTACSFIDNVNIKQHTDNSVSLDGRYAISNEDGPVAYVFNLTPGGFVIISSFDFSNPVLGFSLTDNIPGERDIVNYPAYSVIRNISNSRKQVIKSGISSTSAKSMVDVIVGPWVYTLWGQVNCHNNSGQLVNVTNYYTPNHYAAGCVAISLSTLLHYYKWPVIGEGYHEYHDGYGSSTGWYSADFGSTYYNWGLMKNKYNNQPSTDPEREAAGELAFHAAVSLDMDFEYNGSTSNVNKIPSTGSNYFRFYSLYKQESSSVFWTRLDKNIIEANPVILSVENNSGGGHSIVCDGLWIKDNGSRWYHLNMGWWGSGNGWFTIQDGFNSGGYTTIIGGVLDFIPEPYLHSAQMHIDTNMFTLIWEYSQTPEVNAYEVQQKTGNGSWTTITDDYQDTALLIVVNNPAETNSFRVRAKVNDEWYPNSWSNTIVLDILTANAELAKTTDQVVLYPNPFSNNLSVKTEFGKSELQTLKVYDLTGKMVLQTKIEDGINILNSEDWENGVYFVKINCGEREITQKVIKK